MSPDTQTTVPIQHIAVPRIRDAGPADYPAIREVVTAAYRQYANLVPPDTFRRYLADLLDLDTHARNGRLLVAELDGWVCGFAAFYPDATLQKVGFPRGWASGRALAVHPAARGHGVARVMSETCEQLARDSGAPVLAFHTVSFMAGAIATYERLGYQRAPEFDVHWAHNDADSDSAPIISFAFLRHLTSNATTTLTPWSNR